MSYVYDLICWNYDIIVPNAGVRYYKYIYIYDFIYDIINI